MDNMSIRSHDSMYLHENRKNNPKEYFKFIINNSNPYLSNIENPVVLDIGCATGDFLYYFNQIYPNSKKYGVDIVEELLAKARLEFKEANYFLGDIEKGAGLPDIKFDAVFMSGVHSIFDDYEPVINNVIKLLRKNGRAYIFGIFNPEPIDVIIRARKSGQQGLWEKGWNIFSIKSIEDYLNTLNVEYKFSKFNIGIDIEKNNNDGFRSWTFLKQDGYRAVINGIQILHHFYLLEIINI